MTGESLYRAAEVAYCSYRGLDISSWEAMTLAEIVMKAEWLLEVDSIFPDSLWSANLWNEYMETYRRAKDDLDASIRALKEGSSRRVQ